MQVGVFEGLARIFTQERRCLVCAAVMPAEKSGLHICAACRRDLPRPERGFCPSCGEAAAWPDLPLAPCVRCLQHPPPWREFFFHGYYQTRLRELAIGLKYRQRLLLGHALGGLLAEHPALQDGFFDCVVPVPLHAKRLRTRGFNQALELAGPLARAFKLPLMPGALQRVRATRPQAGADREARRKNILSAFECAQDMQGKHVLLVDDVLTTGATAREATKALLQKGAAAVSLAVLARTPAHRLRAGAGWR